MAPKPKSTRSRARISWIRVPTDRQLPEDIGALFGKAQEKIGLVPNVFRLFALRPEHLRRWRALYDELLRGESGLTPAQREMIAVVVSTQNRCFYWMTSHGAALRDITKDPVLVDTLMSNYRHAKIPAIERRMLDFAIKVTSESETCSEGDIKVLRKDGWSDEDIMDIVEVTAMFNFTNRVANALGWQPNSEYHDFAR
jgi:uncharacterized peroxidase-related enzyme